MQLKKWIHENFMFIAKNSFFTPWTREAFFNHQKNKEKTKGH